MMTARYSKSILRRVRSETGWNAAAWQVAGQAVVRAELGYAVRRVRLTPGHPTHRGRCESYPYRGSPAAAEPNPQHVGRVRVEIVSLLAGGEARLLFTGHGRHSPTESDRIEAAKLAHTITRSADEAAALLRQLRWEAEDLVIANRRAIYSVAQALLASDDLALSGQEVAAILAQTKAAVV